MKEFWHGRRPRLAGLIRRIEHTNTYVLTSDGTRTVAFYAKLHNRCSAPCWLPPTSLRPRSRSARPCAPSTSTSTIKSLGPAPAKPRET